MRAAVAGRYRRLPANVGASSWCDRAEGDPAQTTGWRGMTAADRRSTSVGVGLGLSAVLVWGGQFVVAKAAFAHVGPIQINAIRYVPIALILLVLLVRVEGRGALRATGHWRVISFLGLAVTLFNLLNYAGLHYTRPQNASLIASLTPLLAVVLLWTTTRVRPRGSTIALVLVALGGVVLVISRGHPAAYVGAGAHWGDVLCLLGTLSFAAYTLCVGTESSLSALCLTALSSAVAAVMMVVVAVVAAVVGYDPFPGGSDLLAAVPAIAYIVIPGAVMAMLAWNRSARLIGGQNTALLMNLVPITVLVIEMIRGYRPVPLEIVGAAVVLSAVTANNLLLRRSARRVAVVRPLPAES
jgi:drug/metabolite transporter (DMT)-like permease